MVERVEKGWMLYHPRYGIMRSSCCFYRRDVVAYANADAAPGWDWPRYRKNGWGIIRVEIRPIPAQKEAE